MNNLINLIAFVIAGGMVVGVFLVTTPESVDKDIRSEARGGDEEVSLLDEDISGTLQIREWNTEEKNSVGNPQAPVVIEQYSDYACKFCVDFWRDVMPDLKAEFIDTGYVRYIYTDFITVGGQKAAEAVWCANEQGAFWQYHDAIYSRSGLDRHRWSLPELHEVYAKELDLDEIQLVECFKEGRYRDLVADSHSEALGRGITGVPFFSINGKLVGGFRDLESFREIVLEELKTYEQ